MTQIDILIISVFVVVHLVLLRSVHRGCYKLYLDRHADLPTYNKLLSDNPILAIGWFLFFLPLIGTVLLGGICFLFFLMEYEKQIKAIFSWIGKCLSWSFGPTRPFWWYLLGIKSLEDNEKVKRL